MGRGGRAPCFHSWPWLLPSSSPTRLVAGSPPPLQEQVGSWCPVPRVTWPRLSPAPRPGQHSCGCDRRLGSDSPRHIPGPDTILFCFFFFGNFFSHTPTLNPPFSSKMLSLPRGSLWAVAPGGKCGLDFLEHAELESQHWEKISCLPPT